MSYAFDTAARAWATLRASLPDDVQNGEVATRFDFLLEEMHEANHRLGDAVNHDSGVTKKANALDKAMQRRPA